AEGVTDPHEVAVLVRAEPSRPVRPRERRVEVGRNECLIELALRWSEILDFRLYRGQPEFGCLASLCVAPVDQVIGHQHPPAVALTVDGQPVHGRSAPLWRAIGAGLEFGERPGCGIET